MDSSVESLGKMWVAAVLDGEVPNGGNAEVVRGGHGMAAAAPRSLVKEKGCMRGSRGKGTRR